MTKKPDNFLAALEKGVRTVLEDSQSTVKERMEAINAGTKLMQMKHKIGDSDDEPGSFFKP